MLTPEPLTAKHGKTTRRFYQTASYADIYAAFQEKVLKQSSLKVRFVGAPIAPFVMFFELPDMS